MRHAATCMTPSARGRCRRLVSGLRNRRSFFLFSLFVAKIGAFYFCFAQRFVVGLLRTLLETSWEKKNKQKNGTVLPDVNADCCSPGVKPWDIFACLEKMISMFSFCCVSAFSFLCQRFISQRISGMQNQKGLSPVQLVFSFFWGEGTALRMYCQSFSPLVLVWY